MLNMSRKKILILGCDGYIGFPLTLRCLHNNHIVHGIDNFHRRENVKWLGSVSATDITTPKQRESDLSMIGDYTFHNIDITKNFNYLEKLIGRHKFDVIVNLAHNPSAAFSMISRDTANYVIENNYIGTSNILWAIKHHSPDSHYITIGTTGEYDHTIGVDIEEGYFKFNHKNRTSSKCLFPRQGNSIYHCSKIASTYLIDYLTRIWKLRCTDVMQSIVFGLYTPEMDKYKQVNRCDTDECFGTVINRFVVQALLGEPLTIYGHGMHQRAFLSLNDSIQALEIAINNPATPGDVQTWNQLSEWHSMLVIADMVKNIIPSKVTHVPSPRNEFTGGHYYNYVTDNLKSFGYTPTRSISEEIEYMSKKIKITDKNREILRSVVYPKVMFGNVQLHNSDK
jgi:nucleoside-diphosphate-sugar epimerase